MASTVVGVDIGSSGVRGVELTSSGKTKLNLIRSYEIPLPQGAVSRGEVVEPEVVGSALKRLWSQGGFKSKNVVLGIGNQGVIVRDLSVPKMSLKRIRESLPFQVQSMLQMPLADSILDFYPTSESVGDQGEVVNGLLIAAEKGEILGNIRAAERAGLTPIEVDLIPFALNRLLISRANLSNTVALIDIGGSTTSIIISNKGVPSFVRIIPTGGDDLTQALKTELGIDLASAEELKHSFTLIADDPEGGDSKSQDAKCRCAKCLDEAPTSDNLRSREILNTATSELFASLRSTVNYFNNTHPQDPVVQVLLTGGGSQLSGITEILTELIRVPVLQADPFSTITLPRKRKANKLRVDSSMTVALSLAIRSAM